MKTISRICNIVMVAALSVIGFSSCESGRSYSELLNDENMAVNRDRKSVV